MDDLKYLEEVLPAYRKGRVICDKHGVAYSRDNNSLGRNNLATHLIIEPSWEVLPEYVGWFPAWKAWCEGKAVKVSNGCVYKYSPDEYVLYRIDRPTAQISCIPIIWLSDTGFEVIETS